MIIKLAKTERLQRFSSNHSLFLDFSRKYYKIWQFFVVRKYSFTLKDILLFTWDFQKKNCIIFTYLSVLFHFYILSSFNFLNFFVSSLYIFTFDIHRLHLSKHAINFRIDRSEVFWKKRCSVEFCKIHRKTNVLTANLLKKRLWHRCFTVNFAKFHRIPLQQNPSGRLLL